LNRVHLASDLHLGVPNPVNSRERELRFIRWLEDSAAGQGHASNGAATEIHLVGDIFDFWYEYRRAVPKGGVRLLGAIARISDAGIPVHYHTGNHDMWTFGYLEEELGVELHRTPIIREYDGLRCMIGHGDGLGPGDYGYKRIKKVFHGDGLGPGDYGYKRIKKVFTAPLLQWAYRWVHPDVGVALASRLSRNSRANGGKEDIVFETPENEWLWHHCRSVLAQQPLDCFIFGHRHLPLDLEVPHPEPGQPSARYINLGDWIHHFTAAKIEEGQAELLHL